MINWFNKIWQTYIFHPLAGGNGKIQTSELAQWVMVYLTIRASVLEGNSAEQVYPDIYWICLLGAVCAIAGIKHAFPASIKKKEENS